MYFLIYVLHQIICTLTPYTSKLVFLYYSNRILLLITTAISIVWYALLECSIEFTISSVVRAILIILTSNMHRNILGILPTPQTFIMFDVLGFCLSFLTSITNIEQLTIHSSLLMLLNTIICLMFHGKYIKYTFVFMLYTLVNNLLFKYRNGNNNFIYTSFVWVFIFLLIQTLVLDIPLLTYGQLVIPLKGVKYLLIYIIFTFICRLTGIYALKYNSTIVINLLRIIKIVTTTIFISNKLNILSICLLISCVLTLT